MQDWKQQAANMEQLPIAMAYVPWQKNANMFENLNEAFKIGTIFPALNKPFLGKKVHR